MIAETLQQQIADAVSTLSEQQARQVLNFALRLQGKLQGEPGSLFLERTKNLGFSREDLDEMARVIQKADYSPSQYQPINPLPGELAVQYAEALNFSAEDLDQITAAIYDLRAMGFGQRIIDIE